jgi:H/ACA ribonucleoprotein complex subunit 4
MAVKHPMLPSDKKRKRLIKIHARTNPNYGKKPRERSISELLLSGMIVLDKPRGPTSHQIDSWIKGILDVDRVGHGGTLDPRATGVLPIGLGSATRALQVLLSVEKEYVGIMKLHHDVDRQQIIDTCARFIGEISQRPPVRSAVKRVLRKRRIYYLDVLEVQERDVLFRVGCEAGTYIRTLCVDIGKKLRSQAHLAELRRTRVGSLDEDHTVTLHEVKDSYLFWKEGGNEKEIRSKIFPMERLLSHLPKIVVRDSAVDALCHGANLAVPGVVELDSEIKKGEQVAVFTLKGEGVALARSRLSTEEILQKDTGICADTCRVLMNKGTYPSIWKKS